VPLGNVAGFPGSVATLSLDGVEGINDLTHRNVGETIKTSSGLKRKGGTVHRPPAVAT
jgi:hypothetical protein